MHVLGLAMSLYVPSHDSVPVYCQHLAPLPEAHTRVHLAVKSILAFIWLARALFR